MNAVPVPWIVALAWGGIVGAVARVVVARAEVSARARRLGPPGPAAAGAGAPRRRPGRWRVARVRGLASLARVLRAWRARARARRVDDRLAAELPVAVDLLGVAVRAGATPYVAVRGVLAWSPPEVGTRLAQVDREVRLGAGLVEALEALGRDSSTLRPLADALIAGASLGAPLAPRLERLADSTRADVRRRAETRARAVPVRLLFPLVFLVLPAFGLLTVVPAILAGLRG